MRSQRAHRWIELENSFRKRAEPTELGQIWDPSAPSFNVGLAAGSIWGMLLFLTLGLSTSAGGERAGPFPWEFLLLGCAAFAAGMVTWIGTWRSSSRFPAAVGLAVLAGGMVAVWFPLARDTLSPPMAALSAGILTLVLALSGLLILPCLGRVATPHAPWASTVRMGLLALSGFVASVLAIQSRLLDPIPALLGSVVITMGLAGFGGLRGVRPVDRHAWFAINAGGVALIHLTLLLVRATVLARGGP